MSFLKKISENPTIALALPWLSRIIGLGLLVWAGILFAQSGLSNLSFVTASMIGVYLLFAAWQPRYHRKLYLFRTNVLVMLGSIFFGLLIANIALGFTFSLGKDTRIKADVIRDFQQQGEEVTIMVPPQNYVGEPEAILEGEVFPISGVANANTLLCNEEGEWVSYKSDRYGFRNPDEVWNNAEFDLMIIGDSFAQGVCVPNGLSFSDLLRKRAPRTANLGILGNGPLIELATLIEALAFRPAHTVVWVYYEGNDLFRRLDDRPGDLSYELSSDSLLRDYWEGGYYQQWFRQYFTVQDELATLAHNNIDRHLRTHPHIPVVTPVFYFLQDQWQLTHLQQLISPLVVTAQTKPKEPSKQDRLEIMDNFSNLLLEAQAMVNAEGGQLVFVYVPSKESFALSSPHPLYQDTLQATKRLGIPTIDGYAALSTEENPLALFARSGAHLNDVGNARLADLIENYLSSHHMLPPPPEPVSP